MKVLSREERERLTDNIAGDLIGAEDFIQTRAVANFTAVDASYGRMVADKLAKLKKERARAAPKSSSTSKAAVLSPPRSVPNKSNL